jgi:hypothetical protein
MIKSQRSHKTVGIKVFLTVFASVADPDPEGSDTFGRIRIRSGTEINVLDPDSNPDTKLDTKKIYKKEPYFQAETRWFNMIIQISQKSLYSRKHLQLVIRSVVYP